MKDLIGLLNSVSKVDSEAAAYQAINCTIGYKGRQGNKVLL
jgi:hypothetical protein